MILLISMPPSKISRKREKMRRMLIKFPNRMSPKKTSHSSQERKSLSKLETLKAAIISPNHLEISKKWVVDLCIIVRTGVK